MYVVCVRARACVPFLIVCRRGEHFNGTFTATLTEPALAHIPHPVLDESAHLGEVHSRAETRFHETVRPVLLMSNGSVGT